jgi:hypothetical protein
MIQSVERYEAEMFPKSAAVRWRIALVKPIDELIRDASVPLTVARMGEGIESTCQHWPSAIVLHRIP